VLAIVLLFGYSIIDTIIYSSETTNKSDILKFLHGSRYLALDTLLLIYSIGVAAFGISIEIHPLFLHIIVNCILVARNCGGSAMIKIAILWIMKVFFLLVSIELCYRNFRKLRKYNEYFNSSAHAMLRQALLFSVSMLFLSSSGLRTLYHAINKSLPNLCKYNTSHCGIVNLYLPLFSYDNDKCLDHLTSYVTGREQIRVLRDFTLLNGVIYSIFNANFLDINRNAKYFLLRILLVLLFIALSTSVLVSHVDSLFFINRCQISYDSLECNIFALILSLLSFNLYKMRSRQLPTTQHPISKSTIATSREATEEVPKSPKVLP
jgi:hypothetical protein